MKGLTELQGERLRELRARGLAATCVEGQGRGIVASFEAFVRQGEARAMTGDLCRFLVRHMGVVEHLSIAAFRENFKEPTELVRELDRCAGVWPVRRRIEVYRDGLTSEEVFAQIVAVKAGLQVAAWPEMSGRYPVSWHGHRMTRVLRGGLR